jgi:hypothetical protein
MLAPSEFEATTNQCILVMLVDTVRLIKFVVAPKIG